MSQPSSLFVPSLPTLWPHMLVRQPQPAALPPFSADRAHYFYFARNAVWFATRVLGLDRSEVLVPAYHHGVEVEALVDAGAVPRFYRVGSRWDVDLADLERQITPRTKALYLIHYAGFPGPVVEMRRIADRHGLVLIEDCALSLLSSDGSVPLGTTGDVGIFCLYKTLPVPNGGALIFNGEDSFALPTCIAPPATSTVNHVLGSLLMNAELRGGRPGAFVRRAVRAIGHGTVQAAKLRPVATGTMHFERANVDLGISALSLRIAAAQDFAEIVARRRRNYFHLLGQLRDVSPPLFNELPAGVCPLFYPVLAPDKDALLSALITRGIDAVDFWRFFHPACEAARFPEVAKLRGTIVEIPCHQDLSPELTERIGLAVRDALFKRRRARARAG